MIVASDAFTLVHLPLLISLAQQHRVPAVYYLRTSVAQGALMSYGPDPLDNFRRSASYVDRILKGAKPADLPVQQPTKFELAIQFRRVRRSPGSGMARTMQAVRSRLRRSEYVAQRRPAALPLRPRPDSGTRARAQTVRQQRICLCPNYEYYTDSLSWDSWENGNVYGRAAKALAV